MDAVFYVLYLSLHSFHYVRAAVNVNPFYPKEKDDARLSLSVYGKGDCFICAEPHIYLDSNYFTLVVKVNADGDHRNLADDVVKEVSIFNL